MRLLLPVLLSVFLMSLPASVSAESAADQALQRRQERSERRLVSVARRIEAAKPIVNRAALRSRTKRNVVSRTETRSSVTARRMNPRRAKQTVSSSVSAARQTAETLRELINDERRKAGSSTFVSNTILEKAAEEHVRELAKRSAFVDADFDSDTLQSRLQKLGYAVVDRETCDCASWSSRVSEVFSRGSADPERILAEWLEDESSAQQLLSDAYSEVGIRGSDDVWVAVLGHVEVEKNTPFTSGQQATFAAQVLRMVNAERAKENLAPYVRNELLDASALAHAKDMYERKYFAHESPEGDQPKDRVERTGYLDGLLGYGVGENIARGQKTPREVMEAWMNSPGHRSNILHADFEEIGIGLHGDVWAQNFGKRIK